MSQSAPDTPTAAAPPAYHWHSDGLADAAAGLVGLACGLLYGLQTLIENAPAPVFAVLLPGVAAGLLMMFDSVLRGMRERLVYRRFGIAAPGQGVPLNSATLTVFVLLGALLVLGTLVPSPALPLIAGGVLGALGIALGMRYSVPRYGLLGGLAFLLAASTLFIGAPPPGGLAVLFALLGFVLLVSSTLILFTVLMGGEIRLRRRKADGDDTNAP